jgi:ferredoxin-NADP reductase
VTSLLQGRGAGLTSYVCGSAGFAEATTTLLTGLGVLPGDIRVERFGPS